MIRLHCFVSFLVLCAAVVGCGGSSELSRQAISGTVQIGGAEIKKGAISFLPAPGTSGPAANGTIKNGSYRFTDDSGPFPGLHKVVIDVDPPTQESAAAVAPGPKGQLVEQPPPQPRYRQSVAATPSKVHFELEHIVPDEGSSTKDFEL
ncbi:MAG: hypothetical protein CMJ64_03750 [Planctomycetaceae bacterium]|nr:hypothetical protein [Planctomycetaceae bacterium]